MFELNDVFIRLFGRKVWNINTFGRRYILLCGAFVAIFVTYYFELKDKIFTSEIHSESLKLVCKEQDKFSSQRKIHADFSLASIDLCEWVIVRANWGGQSGGEDYNGGVSPDNVALRSKMLVLTALGNQYSGPLRGVDSNGAQRKNGRRTGAAIMTRQRFRGGRFEAKIKIGDKLGVASAMWTFFYEETPQGGIRNHEIDIEFPGQADEGAPPSLDHVTMTTWTGLKPNETTAAFRPLPASMADGRFHVLRFDWRPPEPERPGVVMFYMDGALQAVTRTNIPSEPGNFWLGAWFPPNWAGTPDFAETEMLVEWARVTPLSELSTD